MLVIAKDKETKLTAAPSFHSDGITIEVQSFGGSLEDPWEEARIDLTREQALQLLHYLQTTLA